jgi:hypothetical protein
LERTPAVEQQEKVARQAQILGDVMKIVTGLLAGVGVLAMAQVAQAAVPKISGVYIVSISNVCQDKISLTKSGSGNVTDVNKATSAQFEETIAKATFVLSNHTFSYTGTRVYGDNLLITGKAGKVITEGPDTLPEGSPWSNTASTLTLAGNVFAVLYGAVNASGVATSAMFQRKDGNCVTKGIAIRQTP